MDNKNELKHVDCDGCSHTSVCPQHHPQCSIVNDAGRVMVIDHRRENAIIEPPCAMDALLMHHHLSLQSLRTTCLQAQQEAESFLIEIADNGKPVTNMINKAQSVGVRPSARRVGAN